MHGIQFLESRVLMVESQNLASAMSHSLRVYRLFALNSLCSVFKRSHSVPLYKNGLFQYENSGIYNDILHRPGPKQAGSASEDSDQRSHVGIDFSQF